MKNGTDDMKSNKQATAGLPICAGCGARIRPDWIIDDVICPACKDKIGNNDLSWSDVIFERILSVKQG